MAPVDGFLGHQPCGADLKRDPVSRGACWSCDSGGKGTTYGIANAPGEDDQTIAGDPVVATNGGHRLIPQRGTAQLSDMPPRLMTFEHDGLNPSPKGELREGGGWSM